MGDSEDDCDNWRSRDKYPKEREVSPFDRNEKRPYNNYQSPMKSNEPPFKRTRRDDDYGNNNNNNRRYYDDNYNKPPPPKPVIEELPNYPTQPLMLQFKSFLQQQEDNIEMDEAMKKYNDYKDNFIKKQLKAFFDAHHTQEWFKEKYAPVLINKRKEAALSCVKKRKEIYEYLENHNWFDKLKLHFDESEDIVKMMDAAVILLEGGNENDLKILNSRKYRSESPNEPISKSEKEITEESETTDNKPESNEENKEIENGEKESETVDARPLHKTYSIFLRNLHPNVLRCEIEDLVKPYKGFLRLALQDPTPDRKFFRRGWVTYDCTVNIKEICWNLNNVRLNDCDIGAIVNRELTQRVRPITVLASHKPVMKQDIKLAAKLVAKFDKRFGIWQLTGDDATKNALGSSNPLLNNITEYLVDEGSYEEEALLGGNLNTNLELQTNSGDPSNITIDQDDALAKVLDKLVIYLRIVHSFDYYSMTEYQIEDEMPHKCGIMHVRGNNSTPDKSISQKDIEEYISTIDSKASAILNSSDFITMDEAKKLGYREIDEATDAFIAENTQKLADDKWLCPLSGKKFKGPEFVKKHILNKHVDKLEESKMKTEYFNNYLLDNKRPQLPEHPGNKGALLKGENRDDGQTDDNRMDRGRNMDYRGRMGNRDDGGDWRRDRSPNNFRNNYDSGRGGFRRGYGDRRGGGRQRNGGSYYSRKMLNYNDLDAPADD